MQDATTERPGSKLTKVELTRERILLAATELFAARGYDGASIRDIEQRADVNRGLVTYHFGNKEDIWKAAFDFAFLPFLEDFQSKAHLLGTLDSRTRLRLVLENFIRMSAARPYMNQLMIQENFQPTWRSDWIIERYLKPARQMSAALGDENDPLARIDSDPHLRYVLLGACAMPYSLPCEARALFGVEVGQEEFIEKHIATVLRLVDSLLPELKED